LSGEDVSVAEGILETGIKNRKLGMKDEKEKSDLVTIGYFSGSTGHDRDFATVAPVLKRLLDEFQQLRIFIGGPLLLPKLLESYSACIDRVSFVPRAENFRNIAKVDINIAPLEIGDPFCEAKSELKFFEAGIVGGPEGAAAGQQCPHPGGWRQPTPHDHGPDMGQRPDREVRLPLVLPRP
jgi:hypothetical protein